MNYDRESIIADLEGVVGKDAICSTEMARVMYSKDQWPLEKLRQRFGQHPCKPTCVVWPSNTEHVAHVLAYANQKAIPIIPAGGLTGVCGGTIPITGGILLDLKRLNEVVEVNADNLVARVQPGIIGQQLEDRLAAQNLTLGHSPSSIYCSTIGGFCATRSAGQFSTKYGKMEDMVQAIELVTPTGSVLRTTTAPKSAAGPDLAQLFLGTEGTLGIITEATLRVHRAPAHREWQGYALSSVQEGLDVIKEIMQAGARPAVVRLYDEQDTAIQGLKVLRKNVQGNLLLLEYEGEETLTKAEAEVGKRMLEGMTDLGDGIVQYWWNHRHAIGYEQSRIARNDALADTLEVAASWDKLPKLYAAVTQTLKPYCFVMAHFSHFYPQGGSIYFTMILEARELEETEKQYRAAWDAAMKACHENSGTITHHHGIGLLKSDWLKKEMGTGYAVLQSLKRALDPKGILNPGKLGF